MLFSITHPPKTTTPFIHSGVSFWPFSGDGDASAAGASHNLRRFCAVLYCTWTTFCARDAPATLVSASSACGAGGASSKASRAIVSKSTCTTGCTSGAAPSRLALRSCCTVMISRQAAAATFRAAYCAPRSARGVSVSVTPEILYMVDEDGELKPVTGADDGGNNIEIPTPPQIIDINSEWLILEYSGPKYVH